MTTSRAATRAVWGLALGRTMDLLHKGGMNLSDMARLFDKYSVPTFTLKLAGWHPTSMSRLYDGHKGVPALVGDAAIHEIGGYPVRHKLLGNAS